MRKVSWEIVLAGFAFMAIGIYLINSGPDHEASPNHSNHSAPDAPSPPDVPGAIIIDLENLENLKELEKLKGLESLKNLESLDVELKNLDKIIREHTQNFSKEQLNEDLKKLEQELQKINKADFNIKLQDQKVYINRDYDVAEAQWTEVNTGVYVFRKSFSVSDLQSMDLNLNFGNINIVGGNSDVGEITLRATGNIDNPADLSKRLDIQQNLDSQEASFQVAPVGNTSLSNRINFEATLNIPQNVVLSAQTEGGHITASNLTQDKHLETSGGHITLDAIEGETVANTRGGHITVDQLSGNSTLTTGGGHIKVSQASGSLSAQTSGGHIEMDEVSGSISAKTSGGNISAAITAVDGPLEFSTSAGNVSLTIPRTLAADLSASGSAVNLEDTFNFSGTRHQGSVEGTLNGGGIPIVINCGYGNVSISAD